MEGNQNKMREALLKLRAEIGRFYNNEWIPYDDWEECDDMISHALSAPPRQCDVGTAEEQADRFANFCDSHSACYQCPVKSRWIFANGHKPSCGVLWAQMPYEAEEGGAE